MNNLANFIDNYWHVLLTIADIALSLAVTVHAVLHKRETRATIGWVGLVWMAPFIGAFTYACFGVNRIQRKATSLKIGDRVTPITPLALEEDYRIRDEMRAEFPNLRGLFHLGKNLTGRNLLPGNTATLLLNGDAAYPAMLDAIDAAQYSISLLSYIFDNDRAGEQFLQALIRARDRGVEIRVLIDGVGARYSKPTMIERLRRKDIRVAAFLPTGRPWSMTYSNLRNHRKILVVDGMVGFTGGTNIREAHCLNLAPRHPAQCAHFKLQGPVVYHLQSVFRFDWGFVTGERLQGQRWFPDALPRSGQVAARGVATGPDEDFEIMSGLILGAITTATRHIRITSPYFLPGDSIVQALIVATLRGVRVDVVIPEKNNIVLVEWAMMGEVEQLIEKGCRVYQSPPPFDHSKLLVIDGVWSLIGSTNWDPRSLRLNFEFNVECYDTQLAQTLELLIDSKIARSRQLTLEQLNGRSFPVKYRDGLARLLSPYL